MFNSFPNGFNKGSSLLVFSTGFRGQPSLSVRVRKIPPCLAQSACRFPHADDWPGHIQAVLEHKRDLGGRL